MRTAFEPITRKRYNKIIKHFNKQYHMAYSFEKATNRKDTMWTRFLNNVKANLPREEEIID